MKKMKATVLLILTFALFSAYVSTEHSVFDAELSQNWLDFQKIYNKKYENEEESLRRRAIWESNLKYINQHNLEQSLGHHTFTLSMNKFGDMTSKEFASVMNGLKSDKNSWNSIKHSFYKKPKNINIPDSVDWRKKGYVTYVKDQGQCGSCWSFSAVASLEGQHFKKNGTLTVLSEQNLVDCSFVFGNLGCDGGYVSQAFEYIKINRGIDTEETYPYSAEKGLCQFHRANVGAKLTGYTRIQKHNETDLTSAIATVGPISVSIDASQSSFQFYYNGIYTDPNCSKTKLDHAVTAVGYGSMNGSDYYIVKNSWGQSWGLQGYILMSRNNDNMCGIASDAMYPEAE